jgi:lipoprotein-anchoring transpeptidase ErfK/SrfK
MSPRLLLAGLPLLFVALTAQTPPPPADVVPTATVPAATGPLAAAINAQGPAAGDKAALKRQLVRAQVLLDRQHFSPGVIDGATGSNMRRAIAAFQAAKGLPVTSALDAATWERLVATSPAPAIRGYVIAAEDVAGPFAAPVTPGNYAEMASRPNMTWMSVTEALAERAHMDEALLLVMNPGVDFSKVGTAIIVADTARAVLPAVAALVVDKSDKQLRAMDAAGKIVAVYPATVGSRERPAPTGKYSVRAVAPAPNYTFDPGRLSFKAKGGKTEKLTIQPGPNNPVGSSWIDLSLDTYGIHGTPHPQDIGKTASNGCVRLTNWDAATLAKAVKAGTRVEIRG